MAAASSSRSNGSLSLEPFFRPHRPGSHSTLMGVFGLAGCHFIGRSNAEKAGSARFCPKRAGDALRGAHGAETGLNR
jgi:hypothetical protein